MATNARVAWVTGAGQGIGRHVALELALRGWHVAVMSRTKSDLLRLADDIHSRGGKASVHVGDATDAKAMSRIFSTIEVTHGSVGLAILNAGTYIRFGVEDFNVADFGKQIDVNIMGTVRCLAPAMTAMIARRSGQIAVVSSLTAYRGLPLGSAYGASKAALTNMCEALHPELARFGVTISVIHPGFVRTPLTDRNDFPMPFIVEPGLAARRIVDGLERGQFEVTFPLRQALLMKLGRILPYSLYLRITRKILGE
jgi:short-subunit dehydrogenase